MSRSNQATQKASTLTNAQLRQAIAETVSHLVPVPGPFSPARQLTEELKARLSEHLDALLLAEAERAKVIFTEQAGGEK